MDPYKPLETWTLIWKKIGWTLLLGTFRRPLWSPLHPRQERESSPLFWLRDSKQGKDVHENLLPLELTALSMIRHFSINCWIEVFMITKEWLHFSTALCGFTYQVIKVLWSTHWICPTLNMIQQSDLGPFKERPGILCRSKMKNEINSVGILKSLEKQVCLLLKTSRTSLKNLWKRWITNLQSNWEWGRNRNKISSKKSCGVVLFWVFLFKVSYLVGFLTLGK